MPTLWLCSCLRNIADRIPEIRKNVHALESRPWAAPLGQMPGYVFRVLLVENDSTDGTREGLLRWASEDSRVRIVGWGQVNAPDCKKGWPRTKEFSHDRVARMAECREQYMQILRREAKDGDLVCVWDLDILGTYHWTGIDRCIHHLRYSSADAACCNGVVRDSTGNWVHQDAFAVVDESKVLLSNPDRFLWTRTRWKNLFSETPVRVTSAFGGLCFYRWSADMRR